MKVDLPAIQGVFVAVSGFLAPVAGSLKGVLSPAELSKAFSAALGAASFVGFGVTFFQTIGGDAAANPSAGIGAAFVAFVAIQLADQLRRLDHGQVAPVLVPGPVKLMEIPPIQMTADDVVFVNARKIPVEQVRSSFGLLNDPHAD